MTDKELVDAIDKALRREGRGLEKKKVRQALRVLTEIWTKELLDGKTVVLPGIVTMYASKTICFKRGTQRFIESRQAQHGPLGRKTWKGGTGGVPSDR